jgi:hypothetical protein
VVKVGVQTQQYHIFKNGGSIFFLRFKGGLSMLLEPIPRFGTRALCIGLNRCIATHLLAPIPPPHPCAMLEPTPSSSMVVLHLHPQRHAVPSSTSLPIGTCMLLRWIKLWRCRSFPTVFFGLANPIYPIVPPPSPLFLQIGICELAYAYPWRRGEGDINSHFVAYGSNMNWYLWS